MAPTKSAPIVLKRPETGRELIAAKWGLVPGWAKDPSMGSRMINARSESITEKPSFRRAFERRRAIVPIDGFYEWYTGSDSKKQPFFITRHDGGTLALAGLYEFWRASSDQDWLITFTLLTTSAQDVQGRIHDRAPLIVRKDSADLWLDPAPHSRDSLFRALTPATPGLLLAYPVSTLVNNVRNNGPELIRPLPLE